MNSEPGFVDLFAPDVESNDSLGVRMGDSVYVKGIEPRSRSTAEEAHDIRRQTRETIDRLRSLLEAAGGSLANLGRVVGYMRNPGPQREAVYDAWEEVFPDASDKPAFKVLNASLPEGVLLRLDCVAVLGQRRTRFDIPGVDARDPTVRIGNLLFTSRLHGTSPETGDTVAGLAAQARQALANGVRLVEMAGGSKADVTQITAFGNDLSYIPELNKAIEEQFGSAHPMLHPLVTFIRPQLAVMVELTASI